MAALDRPEAGPDNRVDEDEVVTAEGPLARTTEEFRAIYLIESDDRDAALETASRIPAARMGGAVEVWPLVER